MTNTPRIFSVIASAALACGLLSGCDDAAAPEPTTDSSLEVLAELPDSATGDDLAAETTSDLGAELPPDTAGLKPTWTQLNDMPQPLWGLMLAAHPTTGLLHGFGGNGAPAGGVSTNSWLYSPSSDQWGSNMHAGAPDRRYCHCMTTIPSHNSLLIVGGRDAMGALPAGAWLYNWDTSAWTTITGDLPQGTIGCHAGWMPNLEGGRAVVFGGQGAGSADPGGMDLKTWLFDPVTEKFTLLNVANTPPGRRDGAVANDVAGGRVLMWGGQTQGFPTPAHTNDLWAFDGTDWSPVAAQGGGPSARRFPAAAFDPQRRLWVIYAGTVETYLEDDLWLFDANTDTWRLLDNGNAPTKRAFAPMAWDAQSQAFYLFGGAQANGGLSFKDGYKLTLQ